MSESDSRLRGNDSLEFTGERFVPGVVGEIWVEHWHRYHFAARFVVGKRVLDIACGEGYGTALLARGALEVTGVDVSEKAIEHARGTYGARNARFLHGSCTAIPLADASVDVAVTFETLEHIAEQREFLAELARVLVPSGLLVLSCPNKREYSDRRNYVNEFHVKEPYREELEALVDERFTAVEWYGQKPTFFSVIAPENGAAAAQLVEVEPEDPSRGSDALSAPLYFVLVASRDRAALDAVARTQSVLADRSDWAYRDYEKVMRWNVEGADHRRQMQSQLDSHARELERRDGWRWWIRWPLVRLGLLR